MHEKVLYHFKICIKNFLKLRSSDQQNNSADAEDAYSGTYLPCLFYQKFFLISKRFGLQTILHTFIYFVELGTNMEKVFCCAAFCPQHKLESYHQYFVFLSFLHNIEALCSTVVLNRSAGKCFFIIYTYVCIYTLTHPVITTRLHVKRDSNCIELFCIPMYITYTYT